MAHHQTACREDCGGGGGLHPELWNCCSPSNKTVHGGTRSSHGNSKFRRRRWTLSQALQTKTPGSHHQNRLHDQNPSSINAFDRQDNIDQEDYRQNFSPHSWQTGKVKEPSRNTLILRMCRMKCPYGDHHRDAQQSVKVDTPAPRVCQFLTHAVSQSTTDCQGFCAGSGRIMRLRNSTTLPLLCCCKASKPF